MARQGSLFKLPEIKHLSPQFSPVTKASEGAPSGQMSLFTENYPKRRDLGIDRMRTIGEVKREDAQVQAQQQQQQGNWDMQYGKYGKGRT
jgi:hypothetical protein